MSHPSKSSRGSCCRSRGARPGALLRGYGAVQEVACATVLGMWRSGLRATMVVVLALTACGDDGEAPSDAASGGACREAPKTLTSALESSLTARRGAKLQRVRSVKIEGGPEAPLTLLKKGAHVASGRLVASGRDPRTVSWVVSESMLTSGGGVAFGLDGVTRKATDLGSAAREGSPIRDYADAISKSEVYEHSRACVQRASTSTADTNPTQGGVSRAKFVKRLNRLCRSATAKVEKIDDASFTSKNPAVVANAFDASVEQYDAVLTKLQKLNAPKADRSALEEYVASIKRSRGVAARIARRLRADKKAAHLVTALQDEKNERLGAALMLGADDCG